MMMRYDAYIDDIAMTVTVVMISLNHNWYNICKACTYLKTGFQDCSVSVPCLVEGMR